MAKSSQHPKVPFEEQIAEIVGEFAHAMKSSLQAIVNAAEHVERVADGTDQPPASADALKHWSKEIVDKCYAIRVLASNYSLTDSDTRLARRETAVVISTLCRGAIDHFEGEARRRRLQIRLVLPSDEPEVTSGDPELLEAAVANLLDNALKYSHAGSTVELRYEVANDQVRISVANLGLPITEADRGRVFQLYGRGQNTRGGYIPGSGIGLYAVRRIASWHGGGIDYESRIVDAEGGTARTTFVLSLPTRGGEVR